MINILKLSEREKQVLEMCLTCVDAKIVGANLHMTPEQVSVHKTRVKRKMANAEKFLRQMKRYKTVLYPKKKYKGV